MGWRLVALLLFFVFAAAADQVTMLWHDARDTSRVLRLVALSMLLESLGWVATWFAFVGEDWRIAVVSILGSGVGTAFGFYHVRRKNRNAIVLSAPCPEASCCPPPL